MLPAGLGGIEELPGVVLVIALWGAVGVIDDDGVFPCERATADEFAPVVHGFFQPLNQLVLGALMPQPLPPV